MVGLEHIILHVGLCKSVARLSPSATVAMHVAVADKRAKAQFDKTVIFQRGTGTVTQVEFDSSWGLYRIILSVPKYGCSAVDYMYVLPDHDRTVEMALIDGRANANAPVIVLGSLPVSFSYAQPNVVLFPTSLPCTGDVGQPLTADVRTQIEQDAYYASLRAPALYHNPVTVTVALQLKDASGGYHYVRIPWKFYSGYAWPDVMQVNIDDAFIDSIASDPEDTLLCPHGYLTNIG